MTTGQYPRRRETEQDKIRRDEDAEAERVLRREAADRWTAQMEATGGLPHWRDLLAKIGSGGRLRR